MLSKNSQWVGSRSRDGGRAFARWLAGLVVAAAFFALPTPSLAQDGGPLWGRGGCGGCHGPLAGGGDDPAEPEGPNLRRSRLDRDLMLETIACGRPGTEMPFNLEGAYTEIECYGIPVGRSSSGNFWRWRPHRRGNWKRWSISFSSMSWA